MIWILFWNWKLQPVQSEIAIIIEYFYLHFKVIDLNKPFAIIE